MNPADFENLTALVIKRFQRLRARPEEASALRGRLLVAVTVAFASFVASSAQSDRDETALYRAGRWFELRN